jgi:hypothetical protein
MNHATTTKLYSGFGAGMLFIAEPSSKGGQAGYTDALDEVTNYDWIGSFPFETKYSGIQRIKKVTSAIMRATKFETIKSTSGAPGLDMPINTVVASMFTTGTAYTDSTAGGPGIREGYLGRPGGWLAFTTGSTASSYTFFRAASDETETNRFSGYDMLAPQIATAGGYNPMLSKFMGCFGDGVYQVPQFKRMWLSKKIRGSGLYSLALNYFSGMIYRGCKHGLINPTPYYSSAVFSHKSFGQFRDMLEPRRYSRFSLSDGSLTEPAVDVIFIDRTVVPDINGVMTNNITSGTATNSSNVSQYATSSHPYDDSGADYGRIKDRSVVMPEVSLALVASPFAAGS